MLSNYYVSNTDQEVAEKTRVKKAQYLNDYQQVVEMVDLLYLSRRQTPEHWWNFIQKQSMVWCI